MNCLEFRRRIEAEPTIHDPALGSHREACAGCAAFAARVLRFDRRLREATRIEVPDGLASRILLRQSFGERPRTLRRRWHAAALAASVLLMVTAGTFVLLRANHDRALAREVVEMVRSAPYALAPAGPVSSRAVRAALGPAGVAVEGDLGRVRFAGRCRIGGRLAGHLVIDGDSAPVTIFFVPSARIAGTTTIRDQHLDGLLIPSPRGIIAVVGAPGERLERYARRARELVRWAV